MNLVTVTYLHPKDGICTEVFEEIIAHQIGSNMVQLVMPNGVQRIINNFIDIDIVPSKEIQDEWTEKTKEAYAKVKEQPQEEVKKKPTLEVVKD